MSDPDERTSDALPTKPRPPATWVRTVAWAGAAFYLFNGIWPMVSPGSFYRVVAPFDPLNVHFLRDAGAFSIGLSAALLIGLTIERRALPAALLAVGIGSIAHGISHVVDHAAGGRPAFDIPSLGLFGVLLVAAGWTALRRPKGAGEAHRQPEEVAQQKMRHEGPA